MAGSLSQHVKRLLAKHDMKILMVGLDASGKTTILYKLKLGDVVTTTPTIDSALWRHYLRNTQGLIFVLDSNDRGRILEARNELYQILSEGELHDVTLLVFANKQDLPCAMSVTEVAEKLALHLLRQRRWYIQGASATLGQGLYEGLDWLSNNILSKSAIV